tara:strand:+ start:1323 stop:1511 length:189 start_codon:yes stop_codon:yes gene_type:complete
MPYLIEKINNKFYLKNITKQEFVNKTFNSKEGAVNAGKNYMRYRNENPIVKGNKIINKKNIK